MTRPFILVTGASGFLGRHVCERLVVNGNAVRGMVRTADAQVPAGVEPAVAADLLDCMAVRRAISGASAVVHLAARVHVMEERAEHPLDAFREVNVEGTRVLLDEAQRAGVSAFVFISSVKAVGEANDAPWNDRVVPEPIDPYGVSKLEAERLVTGREAVLPGCILRLPLVYGPGMKGNMRRLFALVDRGWPLPFGSIENRRALVYCGNVAAAIEIAIRSMQPGVWTSSGPFFISDGHDVSTAALVRAIARSLDRPARLINVPPRLIRAAGRIGDALKLGIPVPFTTAHAQRLLGSLTLETAGFAGVTGFRPPFTMQEGLVVTARWYRSLSLPSAAETARRASSSRPEAHGR